MARAFRRTARGYDVRLDDLESALVVELARDLLRLLDEPTGTDDVLGRLFPDGYRDDPAAATDLRQLIEGELRDGKRAALRALTESLADRDPKGRLLLDEATAAAWLGALNDLRLALGTRLDITQEAYDAPLPDHVDDVTRHALDVYRWLSWLQEGLVEALMTDLPG